MPAKLLKKLRLKLLHPLPTLLLLLAKLQPPLAKLQPPLAKLPMLLLLLLLPPSNSGPRNEKTGLRAGFFSSTFCCGTRGLCEEVVQPDDGFDQARQRLGVGDAQVALRLVPAEVEAGGHRHPHLFKQDLRKVEAVVGMRATVGI